MALSDTTRNITWNENVLIELRIPQRCTLVHEENTGTIDWIYGEPAKHMSHREHIDITDNYVMTLVKSGTIDVNNVSIDEMEGNFITRILLLYALERQLNRTFIAK